MGQGRNAFSGVKVFSASLFTQRQMLGEAVTQWLEEARRKWPAFEVVDIVVRQSSDDEYHLITIVVFFNEKVP